jgi:hypothetical protein
MNDRPKTQAEQDADFQMFRDAATEVPSTEPLHVFTTSPAEQAAAILASHQKDLARPPKPVDELDVMGAVAQRRAELTFCQPDAPREVVINSLGEPQLKRAEPDVCHQLDAEQDFEVALAKAMGTAPPEPAPAPFVKRATDGEPAARVGPTFKCLDGGLAAVLERVAAKQTDPAKREFTLGLAKAAADFA